MKKIALILLAGLLITGCTEKTTPPPSDTPEESVAAVEEKEEESTYVPFEEKSEEEKAEIERIRKERDEALKIKLAEAERKRLERMGEVTVGEEGLSPIDPDTIPENGAITYREIREGVENSYKALIRNGYSKEEAMKDAEMFAQQLGASLEELNSLQGYVAIGETKPAATRPTASAEKPSNPAPSEPAPSEPDEPVVEDNDKNGNGIRDDWEDNYMPADGTVSSPEGTPNPFSGVGEEPKENISEHGYPITEYDKDGNGILDFLEDNYANTDGTVSSPEGTPNPFDMP